MIFNTLPQQLDGDRAVMVRAFGGSVSLKLFGEFRDCFVPLQHH